MIFERTRSRIRPGSASACGIEPGERLPEGPFGEFTGYASYRSTQHVFVAKRVSAVEHSYARTETAIGLGQLQSRRSGSDDDEMRYQTFVVEDRLVGEKGDLLQAGDRGNGGPRPSCDHEAAGLDDLLSGQNRPGAGKFGLGLDDLHAHGPVALPRIHWRNGGDDVSQMLAQAAKIDTGLVPFVS